jgi:hypothetical protein
MEVKVKPGRSRVVSMPAVEVVVVTMVETTRLEKARTEGVMAVQQ